MSNDNRDEQAGRNRGNIATIVVVVVLVIGGYWLYSTLKHANDVQVCAERGLRNCGQPE